MSDSLGLDKDTWITKALGQLAELQSTDFGWGYRSAGDSSAEPTALACLAILAHHRGPATEKIRSAANWLASIQQPDGALGINGSLAEPRWPTAHGALAWSNLPHYQKEGTMALEWLLSHRGEKGSQTSLVSHNPELQGWSWRSGTHSWLEPTALTVLALRRAGLTRDPRTREGIKLILDRTIVNGGWNYGNKNIFGKELRPQPATTGLALMALANLDINQGVSNRACSYLTKTLETVRSPMSLCWGLLGLTAWNQRPVECGVWLQEGFDLIREHPPSTAELSYLLLGAAEEAWEMLAPRTEGSEV